MNTRTEPCGGADIEALGRDVEAMLVRIAEGWRMATDGKCAITRIRDIKQAAE